MITGACLCGEVRFAVDGELGRVSHCHCSMCRRVHGAAFGTYASVPRQNFRWTSGADLVRTFRSSDVMERTFCERCGSTLQAVFEVEPEVYYLTLGTLDGDPQCRPSVHIFVGSKAPWYEIIDNLPQFDEWTDEAG
jgi:hypothetical protein